MASGSLSRRLSMCLPCFYIINDGLNRHSFLFGIIFVLREVSVFKMFVNFPSNDECYDLPGCRETSDGAIEYRVGRWHSG